MLISDAKNKEKTVVFPVKKRKNKNTSFFKRVLSLYCVLLGTAWLTVWFSQASINAYWNQTYHRASPLQPFERFALWRAGGHVQEGLNNVYAKMHAATAAAYMGWKTAKVPVTAASVSASAVVAPQKETSHGAVRDTASEAVVASSAPAEKAVETGGQIILRPGDKVLFAGDSIMQGIAPHVQKWLKSQYEIDSVNLSKQSTGLAYPKFFDWPATIEQQFQHDPQLKLLVILVGANDPWDFPDPDKSGGYPFLKFETAQWERVYVQRMERIIAAAAKNQAQVIWLGIPYMKKEKLNTQMIYLEGVLGRALASGKHDNVRFLPIAELLHDEGSSGYQDSMSVRENEPPVRIRTQDGIHFTTAGQQFMSDYIASYITYRAH